MHCPNCGAAMSLNFTGTFNECWECPFDQQIIWANQFTDLSS